MLRFLAILFGIGFVFAGVAGFMPSLTQDGLLFGWFEIDMMHNVIHIVSGVLAIMAATSHYYSRLYFKLFGIIYLIVALAGFWFHGDFSAVMMHMNEADNFLHTGIAIIALYLGFFYQRARG